MNVARVKSPNLMEGSTGSAGHFDYVDKLRGLAILLVITTHVGQLHPDMPRMLSLGSKYGQMGVQLFFLISAFTLATSFCRRQSDQNSTTAFLLRRLFRIYPMYVIGIAFYGFVYSSHYVVHNPEEMDISKVFANLLLVHGFVPSANNTVVPGGWSIGAEVAFYLMCPKLLGVYCRLTTGSSLKKAVLLTAALTAFSLAVSSLLAFARMGQIANNSFEYYFIATQLPVFCIGMLSYFAVSGGYCNWSRWMDVLLMLLFIPTSGAFLLFGSRWEHMIGSFMVLLAPAVSSLGFAGLANLLRRTDLRLPFLMQIGQMSFSMYIVHFAVVELTYSLTVIHLSSPLLSSFFSFGLHLCLSVGFTFLLSFATYNAFEKPSIAAGRKLVRRMMGHTALAGARLEKEKLR